MLCAFLNQDSECVNYNENSTSCNKCVNRPNFNKTIDEIDLCADCEHGEAIRVKFKDSFAHVIHCKKSGCGNVKKCVRCANNEIIQFQFENDNLLYTAIRCNKLKCWEQT